MSLDRIFATGVLRPRRFAVPLPTDHAVAATFTALFAGARLHPGALLTTSDGTDRRPPTVLGAIAAMEWSPAAATLAIAADCDRVMDHGVWVFYRLMTGMPDWLADRYERRIAGYGAPHAAPGRRYADGRWTPLGEVSVDRLLAPETAGRTIVPLGTPAVATLTGLVILPEAAVPPQHVRSVVALRWDDPPAR